MEKTWRKSIGVVMFCQFIKLLNFQMTKMSRRLIVLLQNKLGLSTFVRCKNIIGSAALAADPLFFLY